ncbi:MAG: hypothetical protein ACRDL5_01505, partial [Solirubrobacteraceae bacterium]
MGADLGRGARALARRAWRWLVVVLALCSGVGAAVAVSASASSSSGGSTTYTTPGEQTFTVPAGVTALTVNATGGQGGASGGLNLDTYVCPGGDGAVVSGVLPVSGGQVLYAEVGGAGTGGGIGGIGKTTPNGGSNGGGSGAVDDLDAWIAGGGGGASDLRTTASGQSGSLGSRLLVAGGGGGNGLRAECGGHGSDAGVLGEGGDAGATAGPGVGSGGETGGGGGTSTAGGTAGANDSSCSGSAAATGLEGVGGVGGGADTTGTGDQACEETGGGGGGGYWGGGGGGGTSTSAENVPGAGGGAGSSWITSSATGTSIGTSAAPTGAGGIGGTAQDGSIVLSWGLSEPPTATITTPASSGATYALGEVVASSFSCTESASGPGLKSCSDNNGDSATITSGETSTGAVAGTLDTSTIGAHSYTVTATSNDGLSSTATFSYTVAVPPTATITTPASGQTYTAGEVVQTAFSCTEGTDGSGLASCDDSNGTSTKSGGAGTLDTSKVGTDLSYTVTATSTDGGTGTATVTYSVAPAPPTATITSPTGGGSYYYQGEVVQTAFSCTEGTGGSGLASCDDSNGKDTTNGGSGALDTSTVGAHTYKVTATSRDGQSSTATLSYAVGALPAATITTPASSGQTYVVGEVVQTAFSCTEGT